MEEYPHQTEGVRWLVEREYCIPSGGLLCDDMGLGKTIQIIRMMLKNRKRRTLIVVPKSLVRQWVSELQKFAPEFSVCAYDGPRRVFDESADVSVCPYSVVRDLQEYRWDRLVLDEGHEIRNPSSIAYKTLVNMNAKTRWIVTGTPVFNKMRDFVTLCTFLGFSKRYAQCYSEKIRATCVLRRIKECVTPITFQNVELDMYESERALYEEIYGEGPSSSDEILEWILRCRQVCAWPQVYYDSIHKKLGGERQQWKGSTAKMDTLVCMIKKHRGEKSIVFTQFIKESEEIERRLSEFVTVFTLNGQTENREHVIESFRRCPDESAVFVIQVKTGGVGLNLQEATRLYIMEPSWNPATELQAIARAHRTGQTKHVYVKKLVYSTCDSVDNEMTELQCKKSKICEQVLGKQSIEIPQIKITASNFIVKLGGECSGCEELTS